MKPHLVFSVDRRLWECLGIGKTGRGETPHKAWRAWIVGRRAVQTYTYKNPLLGEWRTVQ